MNRIKQAIELERQMKEIAEEIQQFRIHLAGGKFQGEETRCGNCHTMIDVTSLLHNRCGQCGSDLTICGYITERKDWIATADVDRWLAGLQSKIS
jgi:hypothetical protein